MPYASDFDPTFPSVSVDKFFGAVSIGGTCAYVLFGVSCSQMVWYFRSYPHDPPIFKAFISLVLLIDSLNLCGTVYYSYQLLIIRGIGMDPYRFVACDHWSLHVVLVLTELCCGLVELFFILRMWRFAERKRLAILAFIPYIISTAFNLMYIQGMIKHPCYPEMLVNRIWLCLAYGLKVLTDGIIAATMIWLLYNRSRGIRKYGGTIQVIRELIYWTLSTGLVLWISTITHLLTYTVLAESLVAAAIYLTRGRIYVIALLAVINDRKRYREAIQKPETISLRINTTQGAQGNIEPDAFVRTGFWRGMGNGSMALDGSDD